MHACNRRQFSKWMLGLSGMMLFSSTAKSATSMAEEASKISNADWKKRLTPEEYNVMREEGTERPFSSPLNVEKREGVFVCAACGQKLFESKTKYDSGTGWPSFYDAIPGSVKTKTDYKIGIARTEYHCSNCGSHLGHVFEDGPEPTGLRYCNNGVSLKFIPRE